MQESEQQQSIQGLSTQLEDKDTPHALSAAGGKDASDALSTSARLVEAEEAAQRLALQLAETEKKYTALVTQQQNVIEVISAQLEMRQSQLDKITGTLGWRLLSRYGRLKYRYLLPIYRLLRLRQPQEKKAVVSEVRENFSATVTAAPEPEKLSSGLQSVRAKIEETEPVQPVTQPGAYDVVIFPIIDWGFRFQRPQQLATQFAHDAHRVFYLRTTFHQRDLAAHALEIAERIFEVQIPGPAHLNIYRDEINRRLLNDLIKAMDLFRRRNMIEEAVCVVQLPFWTPLAIAAQQRWGWKIVYDCMDEHAGFTTNNATMLQHEETLVAQSDLVVTTSRKLYDKLAPVSKRTLALPNATDFEHFSQPGPLHPLSKLEGPIIGYYGAISDWFDVEMVRTAAEARPDWQFVLVGDTFGADVSSLKGLANVHLPGEQPYAAIPSYLHQFAVAIIPFLLTPLTESTNPIKFYSRRRLEKIHLRRSGPEWILRDSTRGSIDTKRLARVLANCNRKTAIIIVIFKNRERDRMEWLTRLLAEDGSLWITLPNKETAFDSHVTYLLESSNVFKIVGFRNRHEFSRPNTRKEWRKNGLQFANLCCARMELQELRFGC